MTFISFKEFISFLPKNFNKALSVAFPPITLSLLSNIAPVFFPIHNPMYSFI